jgi:hypothetical protein
LLEIFPRREDRLAPAKGQGNSGKGKKFRVDQKFEILPHPRKGTDGELELW